MRTLLLIAIALASPRVYAEVGDVDAMLQDAGAGNWVNCVDHYVDNATSSDPLPDSIPLPAFQVAVGKLAAGATPTLGELEAECAALAKDAFDRDKRWTREVDGELSWMFNEEQRSSGTTYALLARIAAHCNAKLDVAIAVTGGKLPIKRVDYDGRGHAWDGDIAGVRTFCTDVHKRADALLAGFDKPFVDGGLKADKLAEVRATRGEAQYYVAKGKVIGSPDNDVAALAAAPVWFVVTKTWSCGTNVSTEVMRRIEFDGGGKLVKTTLSKPHCGDFPKEAFK